MSGDGNREVKETQRDGEKSEAMNGIYYEGERAGGGRWRTRPRENTERVKETEENV